MEKHDDLPLGFGMALAQNEQAMTYFANLTEEQKQSVITATHTIQSKQEMFKIFPGRSLKTPAFFYRFVLVLSFRSR